MQQYSDEWWAARLGKVTASKIIDVIATTKSGYSASRANYMAQLVCERLTGKAQDSYTNIAMQWGTDNEPNARAAYAFIYDEPEEIGFIDHPTIRMSGASPDGKVGNNGLLEIKCPNTATHIEWLLAGRVPEKHKPQMAWQMACTGAVWCDFVSYDPRVPQHLNMLVKRYERDDGYIKELESEVSKFLDELDLMIGRLESMK